MGAYEHYLAHHGIKGQNWGVRRYQNEDGTLTAEGKARYLNPDGSLNELGKKELGRSDRKAIKENQTRALVKQYNDANKKMEEAYKKGDEVWEKEGVHAKYQALGKNWIQRMRSVSAAQKGNGTKEANEYLKSYNAASKHYEVGDEYWVKAQDIFDKLGKTEIGRKKAVKKYS